MIAYPFLIPECNVDTIFVESLHYKSPNHAPSITQVSRIMENRPLQRAMGFVDNDKKQPQYFSNFVQIDYSTNVKLLKHKEREHYLVVVNPAMDEFLYKICQDLDIGLSKYHLPRDFKAFKSFTKKDAIKNNIGFRNLLNTVSQKNPPPIQKIKDWIRLYSPYKDNPT